MHTDPTDEIRAILAHYDLGDLLDYERNDRGFVNTSFALETIRAGRRSRLFLRKYKKGVGQLEIQFEHSLIQHLVMQKTLPVACVHPTRQGKSYVQIFETEQDLHGVFYAIFDYLPGEDKYTWVDPRCTPGETEAAAITLATYHSAVSGFTPHGKREEARICDLFPMAAENLHACLQHSKDKNFDAYLLHSRPLILEAIQSIRQTLETPEAHNLPQLVIHCDYHPGNLKYQGEQVCGLFDFDWSKLDARCFDVGLAAWYFFVSWQGAEDGALQMPGFQHFLQVYQQTIAGLPGVGALTPAERKYLPAMIQAGNLYILNWGLEDYLNKDIDPAQYLVYLRHAIRFIDWYNHSLNQTSLIEAVASI